MTLAELIAKRQSMLMQAKNSRLSHDETFAAELEKEANRIGAEIRAKIREKRERKSNGK